MIIEVKSANNKKHIISTKNGTYKITNVFNKISVNDEDVPRLMRNKNLCIKNVSTLKFSKFNRPQKIKFPDSIYLDINSADLNVNDVLNLEIKYTPDNSSLNLVPKLTYDKSILDVGINNKILSILAIKKGSTKIKVEFNRLNFELNVNVFDLPAFDKSEYVGEVNEVIDINIINGANFELDIPSECVKVSNNKYKFIKSGSYVISSVIRNKKISSKVIINEATKSDV